MTDTEKFWSKVAIAGPTDDWLWTGARHQKGFGRVRDWRGKQALAHRVAYEIDTGITPQQTDTITQTCGNPLCVNPAHLTREVGRNREKRETRSAAPQTSRHKVIILEQMKADLLKQVERIDLLIEAETPHPDGDPQ